MVLNGLNKFEKIYPLFIRKFEDFNPLPENKSITDKVNSMILYLNSVGKLTNDVVNDWNKVMQWVMDDGLKEAIYNKVDQLIIENKLNELIEPIVREITDLAEEQISLIENNQVATKNDLQVVNEQLAQSVKKGELMKSVSDYPTIQDAFTGGGTIYFSEGVHTIQHIVVSSHTTITGHPNAILKTVKGSHGFILDNVENVSFIGLTFDGTAQKGEIQSNNQIITGANIKNLFIQQVKLQNGSMGISVDDVENYTLVDSFAEGFSGWGFSSGGNLTNLMWTRNRSIKHVYDGFKLSGQLKDCDISNNIAYGNGRDGFDFAGHSLERVKIQNNIFENNGLEGIEMKTLTRTEYPVPINVTNPVYIDIEISNNLLSRNGSFGLNIVNQYSNIMPTRHVYIKNNTVIGKDSFVSDHSGIRLASFNLNALGQLKLDSNVVRGAFDKGLRLINCRNVHVLNNDIKSYLRGIELEVQGENINEYNLIETNQVETETGNAIILLANTANNVVKNNKLSSPSNQYRTSDSGSNNIVTQNEIKGLNTSVIPTGRGTKGEIVYSSDFASSNCVGWVCTVTGSNATWKPFGAIA